MPVPDTPSFDSLVFRQCLGEFPTGVTVVTTVIDGVVHGMTANAFMSVSLDPPLVVVSVGHHAKMGQLLPRSGRYGVSILCREQEVHAMHFAGRPALESDELFTWVDGLPYLPGAVVHLGCRIVDAHEAGDHTLFIGLVEHLSRSNGEPLLFHAGGFRVLQPAAT